MNNISVQAIRIVGQFFTIWDKHLHCLIKVEWLNKNKMLFLCEVRCRGATLATPRHSRWAVIGWARERTICSSRTWICVGRLSSHWCAPPTPGPMGKVKRGRAQWRPQWGPPRPVPCLPPSHQETSFLSPRVGGRTWSSLAMYWIATLI